jgi:2-methylaconitate cis-trans-isomerase PrpF
MLKELPCSIYRGGTSKAVFFMKDVLPDDEEELKKVLLKVMGSPDERQIDGLGGAVSTTSKVAIISKEENEDWDVNYTFAQVSVDKPVVSYAGNCGNISSAVGVYAIENNLVDTTYPITIVKVYNTNTKKLIYEHVPTPNGEITYKGDFSISGVPGTASKIELEFLNPSGSFTGKLLPTDNVVDLLNVDGVGEIAVSIVDAANPLVYVDAKDVKLKGTESAGQIDSDKDMLVLLEKIRGEAAVRMGLIEKWQDGATVSPGVPKLTVVSKSQDYKTVSGNELKESDYDLSVRMMSMQKAHKTIALTGALCTAAACAIEGTIPNRILGTENVKNELRFGHSDGIIDVSIKYEKNERGIIINSVSSHRTARKIMTGTVYYENK